MDDNAAAIERLQDTALMLRHACRADTSVKFDCLSWPGMKALVVGLPKLHDASFQTVLIRAGFGLGILQAPDPHDRTKH